MAVYSPALMLQDGGSMAAAVGYWPAVAYITIKAIIALGLWGVAVIGWLGLRLALWQRGLAMVAAFSLVAALPLTDEIGLGLFVVFGGMVWLQARKVPA